VFGLSGGRVLTFHVNDSVLLGGFYKRIVLLLRLAEGVLGLAFLRANELRLD
jgi:hypothetical protein